PAARSPLFSPDGRWIACSVGDAGTTWTCGWQVRLIPVQGGPAKVLAPTLIDNEFWPALVGWSADAGTLYYWQQHRTAAQLFALPLDGQPIALSKGDAVIGGDVRLNATRTAFGFTLETLQRPPEGFVSKVERFEPVQVTRVNDALRKLPLPKTEIVQWKSPDGWDIEGLLTYPPGYAAGKRCPLLLMIHGGPDR